MLITVIQAVDYASAKKQIEQASAKTDGIELRLDYWPLIDIKAISALCQEFNLPTILTVRKKSQGGFYPYNEETRLHTILSLCELKPTYFDIEYDVPTDFLQKIKVNHPEIKLIRSYHNFNETPADLITTFQSLIHPDCHSYKIATQAENTLDTLRMLQLIKNFNQQYILTGICMGHHGQGTRILSSLIGNAMNYVCLDHTQATAPGQLTLNEMTILLDICQISR